MAISERIKFFRKLRGMTQRFLGEKLGFPTHSADVRVAQYETGVRTPKENGIADIAKELNVSTSALDVPNFDTPINVLHSLFVLEDLYDFHIEMKDDKYCLTLNAQNENAKELMSYFELWFKLYERYKDHTEFWRSEYDNWRYNAPKSFYDNSIWCDPANGIDIYPEIED